MKNIASRVARLETKIPRNEFLIVLAKTGEDREKATARVMQDVKRPTDFFLIYINLWGNK